VPGFLSQYEQVVTVNLDEGAEAEAPNPVWWATVRRYLGRGDFKAAQAILISPEMRVATGNDEGETRGKVDTGGYQNELVYRALVDWNLTDTNGDKLPLSPETMRRASIDLLPESVFQKIFGSIEGATRKKPEEVKKEAETFRENGTGRTASAGRSGKASAGPVAVPD
jgi:hypothetical protein